MTDPPTNEAARQALLHLAATYRPDINQDALEGALIGLQQAGPSWTWNRILMRTAAMLAHDETPYDLRNDLLDPRKRYPKPPTAPTPETR